MTLKKRDLLILWYRREYRRRTDAVRRGVADIDWIDPRNRITWTEIVSKARTLGIEDNALDLRYWWDLQEVSR